MKAISSTDFGCPDLTGIGALGARPEAMSAELCAVLTRDDAGQYAVYLGIVPKAISDQRKRDRVMNNGQKLNYGRAKVFFPNLQEREYRA